MRNLFRLVFACVLVLGCGPVVLAEDDPSEQFLDAYMAVQQAEKLEQTGKLKQALAKYKYAANALEQIHDKAPTWQPVIVDYRKKKTAQNILELEKKLGPQAPDQTPEAPLPNNLIEPPLPLNGGVEPPLPTKGQGGITGNSTASVGDFIKQQVEKLQRDKDALAEKLATAQKREAELKVKLSVAQNDLNKAQSDKVVEKRVRDLKDALRNAQIERDAAEEQTRLYTSRLETQLKKAAANAPAQFQIELNKEKEKTAAMAKERDVAVGERNAALQKVDQLTAQLGTAQNQIVTLTKERDEARRTASEAETRLAAMDEQITAYQQERDSATAQAQELTTKLSAMQRELLTLTSQRDSAVTEKGKAVDQLEALQKQVATITADRENARKTSQEASQKFTEAQKELTLLKRQRDESEKENEKLAKKLAAEEKKVAEITEDRNAIARQRDDALATVAKLKEAGKNVAKLLADNTALTQKLNAAELTIKQFNADMPKKDEQIAALKKEMDGVKDQLEYARRQNTEFQASISELQQQLDSTDSEIRQVNTEGAGSEESKRMTKENELLRNIVLREMKEAAKRAESKEIIMDELAKKQIQSESLLKQIEILAGPRMMLKPEEQALFKQPQITLPNVEEDKVEISTTKPVVEAAKPTPSPAPKTSSTGKEKTKPKATPEPQMANLPTQKPDASSKDKPQDTSNSPDESPRVQNNGFDPTVPAELLPQAREAKDFFERNKYRESEKVYEAMLSKAPNNVYVLSNLGVVRFRMGKLKLAEEAFKKAIAIAPKDAFSHCTLGIVYYSQGRDDDAINELTKSIAINSKNPTAHNYLAITAARKGWPEAALKEEEAALALDPNYPDAHFNLAVIYATGQPPNKEMARKHYDLAVKCGAEPDADLEKLIK